MFEYSKKSIIFYFQKLKVLGSYSKYCGYLKLTPVTILKSLFRNIITLCFQNHLRTLSSKIRSSASQNLSNSLKSSSTVPAKLNLCNSC